MLFAKAVCGTHKREAEHGGPPENKRKQTTPYHAGGVRKFLAKCVESLNFKHDSMESQKLSQLMEKLNRGSPGANDSGTKRSRLGEFTG